MIFVTVGTQLAFDRLVQAVDSCCQRFSDQEFFAQIGPSDCPPQRIAWSRMVTPSEFHERVQNAKVLVSHAGMGSILTAVEANCPLVMLARKESLGEHRNDHQLATLKRFRHLPNVHATEDEREIPDLIDRALTTPREAPRDRPDHTAELVGVIRDLIASTPSRRGSPRRSGQRDQPPTPKLDPTHPRSRRS